MTVEELKKQIKLTDLALAAGRKRRSLRTRFVHDEETIPLYENFCFALALFRQRTADCITEGKELIEKLLPFQGADGNFPVYLHDYPRCFDFHMGLRIAPILVYLLRLYGSVLGELKGKIEQALSLLKEPEKPHWKNRYRACFNLPLLPLEPSPDWVERVITEQLTGQTHFILPYDPDLQIWMGPGMVQERGEPRPHPLEYVLAGDPFSPRLLRDHLNQLLAAPLFPLTYTSEIPADPSLRLFWQGSSLHSLVGKGLVFDLPENVEMGRNDLFEAALYTDISPETTLWVEGKRATTFQLGDLITIETPSKTIQLRFQLTEGTGDFFGHIFRSNRPNQVAKETYDWQIGLRTLRRSPQAQITIELLS
jgi:hypothetical protein